MHPNRVESATMLEMNRVRPRQARAGADAPDEVGARDLRRKHAELENENKEVRKIVGDIVSVDETTRSARPVRRCRSGCPPAAAAHAAARPCTVARCRADHNLYQTIIDSLQTSQPRTAELMPKVYDCMVRMNDEDIRKEYITQMEIILNDDSNVGERVKGIAEGMSIKLGEMMDMPRSLLKVGPPSVASPGACCVKADEGGL